MASVSVKLEIKAKKNGTKLLKSDLWTYLVLPRSRSFEHDMCQISTTFVVTIYKCRLSVRPESIVMVVF